MKTFYLVWSFLTGIGAIGLLIYGFASSNHTATMISLLIFFSSRVSFQEYEKL